MRQPTAASPGFACTTMAFAAALLLALGSSEARAAEEAPPESLREADTLGAPDPADEAAEASEEDESLNRSRLSFVFNNDFTTAYMFRGILQERNGFIWQPSIDIGVNLYESDGPLSSVDLGFGIWNSFQSEHTFASGSGPANLYETDYYPSLTLGWSPGLETSLTYLIYTSPNGAFDTIQQLDFAAGYDDSELLGAFAMYPTVVFSFELENTSFGEEEGGYFELALEPGYELSFSEESEYPLTLSFPLAVGLSLYDYYETEESNDTFGFFSFGFGVSVPLAFIPADFGSWSAGAGVVIYVLSDTLKEVNLGDSPFAVGTGSITLEF